MLTIAPCGRLGMHYRALDSVPRATGVALAACVCATALGAGVPLGWVRVASQLQPTAGQGTSGLAALVLIVGPLATYASVLTLVEWIGMRGKGTAPPRRMTWNHSRDEIRPRSRPTTALEQVVILATLLVGLGFEVWLVFFADTKPWGSG
jgi:hypothetical protein